MESRCTHDRDTVCRPCKPGYYNEAVNYEPCKPCTQCSQSEHHGCPAPTSRLDRGRGLPCPPGAPQPAEMTHRAPPLPRGPVPRGSEGGWGETQSQGLRRVLSRLEGCWKGGQSG